MSAILLHRPYLETQDIFNIMLSVFWMMSRVYSCATKADRRLVLGVSELPYKPSWASPGWREELVRSWVCLAGDRGRWCHIRRRWYDLYSVNAPLISSWAAKQNVQISCTKLGLQSPDRNAGVTINRSDLRVRIFGTRPQCISLSSWTWDSHECGPCGTCLVFTARCSKSPSVCPSVCLSLFVILVYPDHVVFNFFFENN